MLKKVLIILFWVLLAGYLFFAVAFTVKKTEESLCTQIRIVVTDSAAYGFIRTADIYPLVSPFEDRLLGRPLHEINTRELEQVVRRYPPVAGAETYTTADGTLCVEVRQRIPILRVINRFQESFFLDSEGKILTPVARYTPHVPVASGYIDEKAREQEMLPALFRLGTYIRNHPFWNAQIQQIYVNEQQQLELIPRAGNHTILWGPPGDDEDKFERLEALYRNALNIQGWDTYSTINVQYRNQIVCTRRDTLMNHSL
jgi:cell division protein FtsQ